VTAAQAILPSGDSVGGPKRLMAQRSLTDIALLFFAMHFLPDAIGGARAPPPVRRDPNMQLLRD
jgi:hypothetical protein